METGTLEKRRVASDLVVAMFHGTTCAYDAISDLSEAGFREVRVALSTTNKQTMHGKEEETHSLPWKIRHGLERDAHRRGAQQMGSEGATVDIEESIKQISRSMPPEWSEVNLQETLSEMGVAGDRIHLVDYQLRSDGVLLLVHVGYRRSEAERIVEQNCGIIRTDTATEPTLAVEKAVEGHEGPGDPTSKRNLYRVPRAIT